MLLAAAAVTSVLMTAAPASADVTGVINNVVTLLSGPLARSLATLAVILTGLAWMFGHLDLRKAGMVIFGIALVFGAAELVTLIAG
jgi:type IV secretion system protein VirB2